MKHLFALLLLPVCALAYNPGPPTNNSATPGPPGQAYVISITGTSAANGTITFAGSGVSQGGANGRTFTFQAGAASNGLNSVVNTTNPAGVASLSGNILYIGTNALSLDTNTVLALINASTNTGARLSSNFWAAAGSTTNYALRRDGRGSPIYGIGNVFSDGGHAAINEMNTRLDLRSTNKSFAVLGLYQTATNLNTDWPPALDLWNYGSTVTGVIPENIRSGKLLLGVHTAEGTWGPQLYGLWGGASNEGFGLVTAFADSFGLPYERTRVTWQGLTVSGRVAASTGFVGDGASLTNIGIAALAQSVTTNIGARLASNVWASADSTTNSVRRLGGNYYATNSWIFANQAGDTFVSIGADSNIVVAVDATHLFQFNEAGFTLFNTPFIGDGSGLADIPLTALRITNTPSAGQVLATSNGTNGYWATVTGGSGSTTNLAVVEPHWFRTQAGATSIWSYADLGSGDMLTVATATNIENYSLIFQTAQAGSLQQLTREGAFVSPIDATNIIVDLKSNATNGSAVVSIYSGTASGIRTQSLVGAAGAVYSLNVPIALKAWQRVGVSVGASLQNTNASTAVGQLGAGYWRAQN